METLREQLDKEKKKEKLKDNLFGLLFLVLFAMQAVGYFLVAFLEITAGWYLLLGTVLVMTGLYIFSLVKDRRGGT